MLQRVRFIDKFGNPCSLVMRIVKRKSKTIILQNPEDDHIIEIPRSSVESIEEVKNEKC